MNLKSAAHNITKQSRKIIRLYPLQFIVGICVILLGLIFAGDRLRQIQNRVIDVPPLVKNVQVYRLGTAPKVNYLGTIHQSNLVTIYAQTAGVVQKSILVKPGSTVTKYQSLMHLSSNYQGGNAASIQRALAQKNFDFITGTYQSQMETISLQEKIAVEADNNSDSLRDIQAKSRTGIEEQIKFNRELLKNLDATLANLESASPSAETNGLILSSKSSKAQLLAGINQLESGLESLNYTTGNDKSPATLANLSKDLTLKQLDLARKNLDLQKELASLQLALARISETLSFPTPFLNGRVEAIHVYPGDLVNPGTRLATIQAPDGVTTIKVDIPGEMAIRLSMTEAATVLANNQPQPLTLIYVSKAPVNGSLFQAEFLAPKEINLVSGNAITVSLPFGYPDSINSMPSIPLDAIISTNQGHFVFVVENEMAKSVPITLGDLIGNFATVTSGLSAQATIILDRSMIDGDKVSVNQQK